MLMLWHLPVDWWTTKCPLDRHANGNRYNIVDNVNLNMALMRLSVWMIALTVCLVVWSLAISEVAHVA